MSKKLTIVKKRTNKFSRFETDRHVRMNVNYFIKKSMNRNHGENQEVSIVELEEDIKELWEWLQLVMDQIQKLDIYYQIT